MTGRERTIATLEFKNPDRIPKDLWIHGAARIKHGDKIDALLEKHPTDMIRIHGPMDRYFYPELSAKGMIVDHWGSTWENLTNGLTGEVKIPALDDIEKAKDFKTPIDTLKSEWELKGHIVDEQIKKARAKGMFIIGGYGEIFQRMQFVRGTEDLLCDMLTDEENTIIFRDKIVEYFEEYLKFWLSRDVDAIFFSDDWGTQRALLMSPDVWRKIFKPAYKKLIGIVKSHGKYFFHHSCGYVYDLYPEFIDIGIDAINNQLHCMDIDKIAENYAGKITFWGEMDRQRTLP